MKSLVNKKVSHNKYGNGKIIEENGNRITIQFNQINEEKQFFVPFAFEKFIKLEDAKLQETYYQLAVDERLQHEEQVAKRSEELLKAEEEQKKESTTKKRKKAVKATKE